MIVRKAVLLFHTVRYLRWKQILYRIYYRFHRPGLKPVLALLPHLWPTEWRSPSYASMKFVSDSRVFMLGQHGVLESRSDWNSSGQNKLWLYNLHYFNDLNAINAGRHEDRHVRLVLRWIAENPPGYGNGWEPYPLSLRIVNWVKWLSRHNQYVNESWYLQVIHSLMQQGEMLFRRIEYHILGNHLFANGKALVFLGAFFAGGSAQRWMRKGLQVINQEIDEQFLGDGGHFELSPMYHATMLWDLCDLINLADRALITDHQPMERKWREVASRAEKWLQAMTHPDGEVSFFNDSALGIAPRLSDIQGYMKQLGFRCSDRVGEPVVDFACHFLKDSGYCRILLPDHSAAFLDLAAIGPDYLPAHAHADTLSFELSLFGQRVFVNSGTSQYGDDAGRLHERGTAAHNTVVIDGENSSEVWAGFRVARRARVTKPVIESGPDLIRVACSHNGYCRLPGKNTHQREWFFKRQSIMVKDSITGAFGTAEARFHLHPDVVATIDSNEPCKVRLKCCGGRLGTLCVEGANDVQLVPATWHPEFGSLIDNLCIVVNFGVSELRTKISW